MTPQKKLTPSNAQRRKKPHPAAESSVVAKHDPTDSQVPAESARLTAHQRKMGRRGERPSLKPIIHQDPKDKKLVNEFITEVKRNCRSIRAIHRRQRSLVACYWMLPAAANPTDSADLNGLHAAVGLLEEISALLMEQQECLLRDVDLRCRLLDQKKALPAAR